MQSSSRPVARLRAGPLKAVQRELRARAATQLPPLQMPSRTTVASVCFARHVIFRAVQSCRVFQSPWRPGRALTGRACFGPLPPGCTAAHRRSAAAPLGTRSATVPLAKSIHDAVAVVVEGQSHTSADGPVPPWHTDAELEGRATAGCRSCTTPVPHRFVLRLELAAGVPLPGTSSTTPFTLCPKVSQLPSRQRSRFTHASAFPERLGRTALGPTTSWHGYPCPFTARSTRAATVQSVQPLRQTPQGNALACVNETLAGDGSLRHLDNNCNGVVDERAGQGHGLLPVKAGSTNLCGTGVCTNGSLQCSSSSSALVCRVERVTSAEVCDGLDNNCNGVVDDLPERHGRRIVLPERALRNRPCAAVAPWRAVGRTRSLSGRDRGPPRRIATTSTTTATARKMNVPGKGTTCCRLGRVGPAFAKAAAAVRRGLAAPRARVHRATARRRATASTTTAMSRRDVPARVSRAHERQVRQPAGICKSGVQKCVDGAYSVNEVTPGAEICNQLDDDCNAKLTTCRAAAARAARSRTHGKISAGGRVRAGHSNACRASDAQVHETPSPGPRAV